MHYFLRDFCNQWLAHRIFSCSHSTHLGAQRVSHTDKLTDWDLFGKRNRSCGSSSRSTSSEPLQTQHKNNLPDRMDSYVLQSDYGRDFPIIWSANHDFDFADHLGVCLANFRW